MQLIIESTNQLIIESTNCRLAKGTIAEVYDWTLQFLKEWQLVRRSALRPDMAATQQVKEASAAALASLALLATVVMGRRVSHLTKQVMGMFSKKIVNS